jgi:hypothetical protein
LTLLLHHRHSVFPNRLADTIEAEGGLALMVLTHRDDVADHAKWKQRFPAMQRAIHRYAGVGCENLVLSLPGSLSFRLSWT